MRGRSSPASRRLERGARGRRKHARRVASALDRVLEELGLARVVEQHAVFSEWESRVGAEIAAIAKPYRIDGDTLIVRVENAAWMNELSLRQNEVMARLNEGRRRARIDRLVLRLDPGTRG